MKDFYTRRIWRLQPALIAVIALTLAIAIAFYLPDDLIRYLKESKYTSLFISNQYFARSTTAYAAPDSAFLLLLHTWSLSIEWQWYLVLPIAMILLFKYVPEYLIKIAVIILTLIFLVLSLYLSWKFPNKSYYFLLSRIFEFLFGSSLVVLNRKHFVPGKYIASLLGVTALTVLVYCATRTGIVSGYPDYHAVAVAAASAILIFAGSSDKAIVTRALTFPPIVFIGTISYSLYLWHWPIFATGRYLGFTENTEFTFACFIITFVLAGLSYRYIEKPFRKIKYSLLKSISILVLIPVVLFTALTSFAEKYDGFAWRFGTKYQDVVSKLKERESKNRKYCIDIKKNTNNINSCVVGDANAHKKALLIGDSFSNHYWGFIDVLAKDANISVLVQGTSSCLTLPGIYLFDWWYFKNTVYQKCHDDSEKYFNEIRKGKFDYVIIGEIWSNYAGDKIINKINDERSLELSRKRIVTALKKSLDIIIKSGAKPVIIKQTFLMPKNYMRCFYDSVKLRKFNASNTCTSSPWLGDSDDWFATLFTSLKKDYPELIIIDPKAVQCSGAICRTVIDGVPVYRDVGHITDYASYTFGNEYLNNFGNPFK